MYGEKMVCDFFKGKPRAMSEPQALYLFKGKQVMVGSKKGIVEKMYPSGLVKVRLEHGPWIGPPAKLSECEDVYEHHVTD